MKATLEARFPRSELRYGELLRGADGKVCYLRPLRLEMYHWVVERLRTRLGQESAPVVYLCMESPEVWKRVFHEPAPTNAELEFRFAENYQRRFPQAELLPPLLEDYQGLAATGAGAANLFATRPQSAFIAVEDFGL